MSPLLVTLWGLLVAACLPVVMRFMLPPVPPFRQRGEPACVLVLGAGRKRQKTLVEGARVQLSSRSLTRLEMGLSLARQKKLPMLIDEYDDLVAGLHCKTIDRVYLQGFKDAIILMKF